MMKLEDVKQWIDNQQPEIEATLEKMVNINTFTANRSGVDDGMDEFCQIAQSKKITVEVVNGRHRLIKVGNGTARPRILLISHMDTVFPPDGDFLKYEPLEDGFVRGPGTGDIKGGLIMGFWAMLAIRELCTDFDVQMVISANEEIGSPTIKDWYLGGHVGADFAIGLEPGFPQGKLSADVPLGVVYQRRGYGVIPFTVHGKGSHSGVAHLGLNAILAAAERITRIHQLDNPAKGISVNVGMIEGGTAANTVPGEVTGKVSFRFESQADGEATRDAIMDILKGQYVYNEEFDLWDSCDCEVEAFLPPMEKSERNQVMVDIVLEEAKRLGQNVVPIARGGGSDANFISGAGTPAICGMGAPTHGLHTKEEMIHLPMMIERIELLTATLYRLIQEHSV
ncbi:MAG: M20/M25/M40 family metallo-hydrolase [Aggregatilineales bacterium]